MKKEISLELLADYYEYTMANGYHELGMGDEIVYFDVFYRNVPDGGGFAICGIDRMRRTGFSGGYLA